MPPAFITAKMPDGKSGKWLLDRECVTIGRQAPADIILPFLTISRQHAEITRAPSGYHIADLESRNGTCIGKERIGSEPRRLNHGDEIILGGAITLRFNDPDQVERRERATREKGIFIDEVTHEIWLDGKPMQADLSDAQMALLLLLYHSPNQIISRDQVIATAWPKDDPNHVSDAAVDGLIKRLRASLRKTQPEKEYVQVLRGKGIRLLRM